MATRFYFSSEIQTSITPAFTHQATWTETDGAGRHFLNRSRVGTALSSLPLSFANAANTKQLFAQFVSDPLAAQTIASTTTFKGTIRCSESAANDNIDAVSCKVVVTNGDGSTLRGALVNLGNYGPVAELATSLRAKRIADGDTVSAQVITVAGDRLVVEIGLTSTVGGTSITGTMNWGDNAANDLADNEADTSASNPFIEFSHNFVFQSFTPQARVDVSSGLMGLAWR